VRPDRQAATGRLPGRRLGELSRIVSTYRAVNQAMSIVKKLGVLGLLALGASDCGPLAVDGYPVHSAAGVPSAVDQYPHILFQDREAYLVGNEWLYRDPTYGWVVFEQEPPTLKAFREEARAAETRSAH
jgi:hypothetical protein